MTTEKPCSDHPDAPHGFVRNASHMAGHYVCECSGWTPPDPKSLQERLRNPQSIEVLTRAAEDGADRIDALEAKLDQYRVEYFQTLRERDEYRKCADDAAMAHKVERDTLKVQIDALTKDAERYHFLKEVKALTLKSDGSTWKRDSVTFVATHSLSAYGTSYGAYPSLDELVDAAMKESK